MFRVCRSHFGTHAATPQGGISYESIASGLVGRLSEIGLEASRHRGHVVRVCRIDFVADPNRARAAARLSAERQPPVVPFAARGE